MYIFHPYVPRITKLMVSKAPPAKLKASNCLYEGVGPVKGGAAVVVIKSWRSIPCLLTVEVKNVGAVAIEVSLDKILDAELYVAVVVCCFVVGIKVVADGVCPFFIVVDTSYRGTAVVVSFTTDC